MLCWPPICPRSLSQTARNQPHQSVARPVQLPSQTAYETGRTKNAKHHERLNMKLPKLFTLTAITMLPPLVGCAQTAHPLATQPYAASMTTAPTISAGTNPVAPSQPPPPQAEVIPVSPGADYLWTPGWWSWNGDAWIWFGGYWGHPTRPGHVWYHGNFYHGRGAESLGGHRR
jgi:hypothetical protein